MDIYTKLNMGDDAWLMSDNKAICKMVTGIRIDVFEESPYGKIICETSYQFVKDGPFLSATLLFPSKDQLLSSL